MRFIRCCRILFLSSTCITVRVFLSLSFSLRLFLWRRWGSNASYCVLGCVLSCTCALYASVYAPSAFVFLFFCFRCCLSLSLYVCILGPPNVQVLSGSLFFSVFFSLFFKPVPAYTALHHSTALSSVSSAFFLFSFHLMLLPFRLHPPFVSSLVIPGLFCFFLLVSL